MPVFELRVAITTEDFDRLITFYRDGLGLDPGDMWTDNGRGQILHAGRAVLEVLDNTHATHVDMIETGKRVSGSIRFAFEVPDIQTTLDNALNHGATLVHEPVLTPWGDVNVRIESPDGMQITLFQTSSEKAE